MKPEVIAAILGCEPPEQEMDMEQVLAKCDSMAVAYGTEARVIAMIAERQELGIRKYGQTVAENPLTLREWLQHALEETLDKAIYLQRAIEEIDAKADTIERLMA